MKDLKLTGRKKRASDVLVDALRQQISEGSLRPEDFLLPERKLAEQYQVSSRAVREGLAALEAEGLISRQHGRGTVVLPQEAAAAQRPARNIAVIFLQRMKDASTIEFFDALQQTFQRGGYGTTILISGDDPEKETAIVNQLVQDGVPGIVLFSAHQSDSFAHLQAAQDAGVKVALFDHYFPALPTNFVGIDDRLGAYEATAHLIHQGCEEMIFINSGVDWSTHTLRQKGFEDAVAKLGEGMPFQVLSVPAFDGCREYILEHLPALLDRRSGKVGIVAWSDQAALTAMACAEARGLSIPGEVAVIGFSDDPDSAIAPVPLTTMKIPREEIARLSAYLLLDQLREPKLKPEQITMRPNLIIRESCGCHRPRKVGHLANRKGFSLVELLTTLALCAVLVALGFPMVKRMNSMGASGKCVSQQKEILTALFAYTADNNGTLPSYGVFGGPAGSFWWEQLSGYLGGTDARPQYAGINVLRCPAQKDATRTGTYGLNYGYSTWAPFSYGGTPPDFAGSMKLSRLSGNTFLFADCLDPAPGGGDVAIYSPLTNGGWVLNTDKDGDGINDTSASIGGKFNHLDPRHGNSAYFAFADGSVRPLTVRQWAQDEEGVWGRYQ